jgi:hypothetical protein
MKLSGIQVVGVLAVALALGALKWTYGRRHRGEREELDRIERESREDSERRMNEMEAIRAKIPRTTGVAACDAVMKLSATPPKCPTAAGTQAVQAALDKLLESPGPGDSAVSVCERVLAGIETAAVRENCR